MRWLALLLLVSACAPQGPIAAVINKRPVAASQCGVNEVLVGIDPSNANRIFCAQIELEAK